MKGTSSSGGRRLPIMLMLLAILVATAVMAIGVALGGGTAVAKKQPKPQATSDATIEATTFKVADRQTGEEYAKCPSNKRVVGGGVVQSGPPIHLYVRASGPLDETGTTAQTQNGDIATQWYAAVVNVTGAPVTFKVFAICSAKSDATIEATSFQLPAGKLADASAVCPPNKRALGGGMVQSGPPEKLEVNESGPLDETGTATATQSGDIAKEWYAAVDGLGEQQLRTLKVFALCSAKSNATIVATTFQAAKDQTGQESEKEEYAKCPANKRALGGGVVQNGPLDYVSVHASGPLDETGTTAQTQTGDIATQWYTAVRNYDAQNPLTFEVSAICQ